MLIRPHLRSYKKTVFCEISQNTNFLKRSLKPRIVLYLFSLGSWVIFWILILTKISIYYDLSCFPLQKFFLDRPLVKTLLIILERLKGCIRKWQPNCSLPFVSSVAVTAALTLCLANQILCTKPPSSLGRARKAWLLPLETEKKHVALMQ